MMKCIWWMCISRVIYIYSLLKIDYKISRRDTLVMGYSIDECSFNLIGHLWQFFRLKLLKMLNQQIYLPFYILSSSKTSLFEALKFLLRIWTDLYAIYFFHSPRFDSRFECHFTWLCWINNWLWLDQLSMQSIRQGKASNVQLLLFKTVNKLLQMQNKLKKELK